MRGGDLDADIIRADAQRMHSVYGIYGISVFAPRGLTLDELAQQPPLVRFSGLTILTVADIRAAGLRLEATGRNPRHFTIILADLDGAGALSACPRRRWPNPYHDP
ncbi:MAG TPA: hypothetical protein VE623_17645 [Acidimicrobiales bacterium]|nr:hypothetical protein [Acidimicrobiales bacterium]